jgi:hypothetical protein
MISRFPALARLSTYVMSIILILTSTLSVQAQSDGDTLPRAVTLMHGQVLELSLVKPLNSRHARVGDDVVFKLAKPLMADGVQVLPAEWLVHGRIADAKPAAKNCQPGSIRWDFNSLAMKNGTTVEIHSVPDDVAMSWLRDEARQDADKSGSVPAKSTGKTGTSVGSAALTIFAAPITILLLSVFVLADIKGYDLDGSCQRGKGKERSIRAGTAFYAAITNDVQQPVD